jgi:alginate O-acetyltransferase complex protein AlgI
LVLFLYHLIFLPVWRGSTRVLWRHVANLFLLLVSLLFYFWGEKNLVWIFIATVVIDYLCALLISGGLRNDQIVRLTPGRARSRFQKSVLAASVCSNMALLGCFKYFNFGVDSYNSIVAKAGVPSMAWSSAPRVLLPLGISFFVFHSMSYTIDVYRGYVTATRNMLDYSCYVLMFPQLVAGPIVRYSLVERQLTKRGMSSDIFASGVARFLTGLSKKVLIANSVSIVADRIFALPASALNFDNAWIGLIAYTLQIYFDFSGYSDMAIGLGRMLGFELPINFDYPYAAISVRDFWRRWHISLSTWFRDYLFIPLGGSRTSSSRTYANLVTVFFLCGLWHGAKWTFVAWGLYHGLFLVLERWGLGDLVEQTRYLRRVYTLLVVMGGWVLFRSDSFAQALGFLRALAGMAPGAKGYPVQWFMTPDFVLAVVAGVIFSAPVVPALLRSIDRLVRNAAYPKLYVGLFSTLRVVGACVVMLACAAALASGTHNPFIYFRF